MAIDFSRLVVVEMTEAIAGPTTGQVLSDLGATVIKVENPRGGDSSRRQGDPNLFESGSLFHMMNRGKRSVAIDLQSAGQVARLRRFIGARAQVFLQNLRPGVVARLGLGPETLLRDNPRLVYCAMSGWPARTRSEGKAGYDLILQAFSGMLQITGEPDGPPCRLGVSAIDLTTGLWGAIAILQALARAEATGKGGVIETSLLESAAFLMSAQIGQYQFTGRTPRRWGTGLKEFVPLGVYPAADADIALAAATDKLFAALAAAIGRAEMAADDRFRTVRAREANRAALDAAIAERLRTRPAAEWLALFEAAGVPASPVNSVAELIDSPELEACGQLVAVDGMETLRAVAAPYRTDGQRPPVARRSERLGESTAWFLDEIARLPPEAGPC